MKTIVGFGASSMQGVGDPAGGFFTRLSIHPLLTGLGVDFKNHGSGGNNLRDMLERAPQAVALKPYDLIVILGCNDLPRNPDAWAEKRTAQAEYQTLVAALLKKVQGERSLFITSFAVSQEKTGVNPRVFEAYMSEAAAAATVLGYEVWDLYQETKQDGPRLWADDGLHFNAEGHALIADHVAGWIRPLKPSPASL